MSPAPLLQVDHDLLVCLDHLLTERSMAGAATAAGMSVAAMIGALGELRRVLGDQLLEPAGSTLAPTAWAQGLGEPLRQTLASHAARALAPRGFRPEALSRTFTIVAADHAEMLLVAPLLRRLRVAAPGIRLRVLRRAPIEACDLLLSDRPGLAEVRDRPMFSDRLVSIVDAAHPGLEGDDLSLDAWLTSPHLRTAWGDVVDAGLAELGLTRTMGARVPGVVGINAYVRGTDLVATVPRRVAHHLDTEGLHVVAAPLPLPAVTLSMRWHPRLQGDPGHTWLRELLAELAMADTKARW